MIKQNTDRKFSESFIRMHACVSTMRNASLFAFVKSTPTPVLVLGPLHMHEPGYRDGSVSGMNFVVCSYGKFQPGYRDEKW